MRSDSFVQCLPEIIRCLGSHLGCGPIKNGTLHASSVSTISKLTCPLTERIDSGRIVLRNRSLSCFRATFFVVLSRTTGFAYYSRRAYDISSVMAAGRPQLMKLRFPRCAHSFQWVRRLFSTPISVLAKMLSSNMGLYRPCGA